MSDSPRWNLSEEETHEIVTAMYQNGDDPGWLTTVDGSPNAASYDLLQRIKELIHMFGDRRAVEIAAERDKVIESLNDALYAEQEKIRKIIAVTDDLKKHNGYGGSSCGVCSGHSPSWDGHSRNCKKAYPKRVRDILNDVEQ